jgi:arylsulfatase A-like enzyme
VDQPLKALIQDLKQRGLLDQTLIVFGGEFGRTPMRENRGGVEGPYIGRDHHPYAYTMMLAGAGIQRGLNYGETDDIGYYVTKDKMTPRDLQATVLQQLGLDPYKLHYPYQGLNQRLIGPTDEGRVMKDLLI